MKSEIKLEKSKEKFFNVNKVNKFDDDTIIFTNLKNQIMCWRRTTEILNNVTSDQLVSAKIYDSFLVSTTTKDLPNSQPKRKKRRPASRASVQRPAGLGFLSQPQRKHQQALQLSKPKAKKKNVVALIPPKKPFFCAQSKPNSPNTLFPSSQIHF